MIGSKIYRFKEIDSTMEFAKTLVKEAPEWTLVIADAQTSGRGRLGRKWYSPEGGLWFSLILRPKNFKILPLAAGVAICESMKELGVDARIKWPNDILIRGKKVSGILTEIEDGGIILGIGINLNIRVFPEEIENIVTSLLLEKGKTFEKEAMLDLILEKLQAKYKLLQENKIKELLEEFRANSITFGKKVAIKTPTGTVEGEAVDVDEEDGALLLRLSTGVLKKIFAGECTLIK